MVVAEDDHRVGLEGIELVADAAQAGEVVGPVLGGEGGTLIAAPFLAHARRPVGGILEVRGQHFAGERGGDARAHFRIGKHEAAEMRQTKAENFRHMCGQPPVTLMWRASAGRSWRRSMMKSWPLGLREMASRIAASITASSALARSGVRRSAASSWPRHM